MFGLNALSFDFYLIHSILTIVINSVSLLKMSLATKLRRMRKKPPEGWDLIEPTLEEFEAKMREAETEPHEVCIWKENLKMVINFLGEKTHRNCLARVQSK